VVRNTLKITRIAWLFGLAAVVFIGVSNVEASEPRVTDPPPSDPPPNGLPGSAPLGKGIGKGPSVAWVTYTCMGIEDTVVDRQSPYSYLADSMVVDAGGGSVSLEGAATADLVADDAGVSPRQMAGASVTSSGSSGMTNLSYDACGTSAASALNAVVMGEYQGDATAVGTAAVEFIIDYNVKLEIRNNPDSDGGLVAFTSTSLQVLGLDPQSFRVNADGKLINVPDGLTVTKLSVDSDNVYLVSGLYTVFGTLNYGYGRTNHVLTTFEAGVKAKGVEVNGSTIVVEGFAAAEAVDSITYKIVSLDPNVAFWFVSEQAPEGRGDNVIAASSSQ
jgi:hypothetical protein